jgi:putative peptidoglycan lipid II flippase
MILVTVTFPALARNIALGNVREARRRLEADLRTVSATVLITSAYVIIFAH